MPSREQKQTLRVGVKTEFINREDDVESQGGSGWSGNAEREEGDG